MRFRSVLLILAHLAPGGAALAGSQPSIAPVDYIHDHERSLGPRPGTALASASAPRGMPRAQPFGR